EVVVFRHPTDPGQAYVKRVVGLPEETVEVIDGDVYANGHLQRKSLPIQRSMRICVYDHDCSPADIEWQPRWRCAEDSRWSAFHDGFVHRRSEDQTSYSDSATLEWLTYHHWMRSGGEHRSSVELAKWPEDLPAPRMLDAKLTYDEAHGRLECWGVLPSQVASRLAGLSSAIGWRSSIETLARR